MDSIPLHKMDGGSATGFQIKRYLPGELSGDSDAPFYAHRDDHYSFFIMESGEGSIMVDFSLVELNQPSLLLVLPAQVHHLIRHDGAKGWFLAIDTSIVPASCRELWEGALLPRHPVAISVTELSQCSNLLKLIGEKAMEAETDPLCAPVAHALVQAFILIAANMYMQSSGTILSISRQHRILLDFKKLLAKYIRRMKSPTDYAAKLNISESYLNEVVKNTSGFPVSYWIHNEVVLEAKRLLYYSELTSKEIAHMLGYTDHSYFGRIFTKEVGIPPLAFRKRHRK